VEYGAEIRIGRPHSAERPDPAPVQKHDKTQRTKNDTLNIDIAFIKVDFLP